MNYNQKYRFDQATGKMEIEEESKDLFREMPDPDDPNEIQGYPSKEKPDTGDNDQKLKDYETEEEKKEVDE